MPGRPLRVYLDQCKWIELGRIFHGKEVSAPAVELLTALQTALAAGWLVLPLSAVHYMELARVSNDGRRARLGAVMHALSRGVTLAPAHAIIEHEIEVALASRWPQVTIAPFELLGQGIGHAFGAHVTGPLSSLVAQQLERAVLAGDPELGVASPTTMASVQRGRFVRHLQELDRIRKEMPRADWDDAICGISLQDIVAPIERVLRRHSLEFPDLGKLGKEALTQWLLGMPTRRVDLHLHRQVLKDAYYAPKASDLEDWGGLVIASCYCDIVVCEKHMAAMFKRDGFASQATILTSLSDLMDTATRLRAPSESVDERL